MRRYQKGMVLMVEHILFAVLTAAVIGAAIFMWWFENHDEKQILEMKRRELSYYEYRINYFCNYWINYWSCLYILHCDLHVLDSWC